jgi:UDP-N-acetylglucosamine--N-acetylmuramyl-(pentapeptide) pyrophosphoryl-undecaprenol N-acetylglucosamine transferase
VTASLGAAAAAGWAVLRCAAWMARERPELVIGSGGYASGPAVLAARLLRVRTMLLEQNHFPGATNRWLAPRVDAVCVPSREAARRLRGRIFVTGNPVRPEFPAIGEPPGGARASILVFGGSRGARSINRAMREAVQELGRRAQPPRIAHQTGAEEESAVRGAYSTYPGAWEVRAFFDDLPERLAAADLAICRAGATTIAELCAAGRAAILVPYPHAADDHQRHNAEALVAGGAARLVPDAEVDGPRLVAEIDALTRDPQALRSMGRAARALARPDAARHIADIAERLIERSDPGGGDVP